MLRKMIPATNNKIKLKIVVEVFCGLISCSILFGLMKETVFKFLSGETPCWKIRFVRVHVKPKCRIFFGIYEAHHFNKLVPCFYLKLKSIIQHSRILSGLIAYNTRRRIFKLIVTAYPFRINRRHQYFNKSRVFPSAIDQVFKTRLEGAALNRFQKFCG